MKFKYYIMSLAVAAVAFTGFTSCSDDDDDNAPEVVPVEDLTLATVNTRVKVGPENRIELPVATGAGEYSAYSLNPAVADIEFENGVAYIVGLKNGTAEIVVTDAQSRHTRLTVGVYTTDQMTLSHSSFEFVTPLGIASTNSECTVVLGNGEYTVESDNPKVVATIDPETGVITLTAKSGKDEYVATVTVTDCTGLSASIEVKVTPTFDAFTDADIANLIAKDNHDMWLEASGLGVTQNRTSEYPGYINWYGSWDDNDYSDGTHRIGWGDDFGSSWSYGGQYISYPTGTALNEEVDGKYIFQYYYRYTIFNLPGKVKIIRDDATVRTVIWWSVDLENECISRGWVVKEK